MWSDGVYYKKYRFNDNVAVLIVVPEVTILSMRPFVFLELRYFNSKQQQNLFGSKLRIPVNYRANWIKMVFASAK